MQGTILYGARDVRFEDLPAPHITTPTDAVIRLSATCICGSCLFRPTWALVPTTWAPVPTHLGA